MPIYKRGMIESINVNYTPTGLSLFAEDNCPVFVIFSFLFQEIEVFTANDFGAGSFDVSSIESNVLSSVDGVRSRFEPELTSVPSPVMRK